MTFALESAPMIAARPVRLRLSRARGFNLHAHSLAVNGLPAVNCARPGLWGNPFVVGQPSGCDFNDGGDPTPMIAALTLDQSLQFYRRILEGILSPEMHPHGHRWHERFRKRTNYPPGSWVTTLRGYNLACFCGPDSSCHCDILLELANPAPAPQGDAG